jgi:hypothetical protein
MKKNYTLLTGLVLASSFTFAQDRMSKERIAEFEVPAALTSEARSVDPDLLKAPKFNSKSFGDTLYSQDFAGGLPAGWSVVNNNPNNFQWVWNTVYQNGQFSAATNIITSTSAANGFMVMTGDFFNTPIPGPGAVAMDSYFESDAIDLTKGGTVLGGFGSVWVTYQQALRYCCSSANRLVLQASTDNFITFQEYDATNAIPVNSATGTVSNVINISTAAANAGSVKIRFVSEGNSHYYWMIDDFAIVEGPSNDMEIRDPYLEFNFDYVYNPFYGQTPYDLFPALPLSALVYNNGSNDATGVTLEGEIFHTADPSGGPGIGSVYATASTPVSLLSGTTRDTADYTVTNSPRFVPLLLGEFRTDMILTSDSVDENLGNESYSQTFTTSDTVFARDDNGYGGGTGPGSYVRGGQTGGQVPGDAFGTMYIVESRTGSNQITKVPTSITFAVSDDPANIGVEIIPTVWRYEEDSLFAPASGTIAAAFSGGVVATSFIPYTILSTDTNTLLTLPLDNGSGVFNGLDSGQYIVGWTVSNTNGGNSFEVYEDESSGVFQDAVTSFIDLAHSPGWGWVSAFPVIRLNMANLPLSNRVQNSIASSTEFSVNPNPNNGLFTVNISTKQAVTYNLNVRNMLGQEVYTDLITVNGTSTEQMDLTQFNKGVYFVTLENGAEKLLKKVVVK